MPTPGFECAPAYIESIRPDAYPKVLRNIIYSALLLNGPLMLIVYALLPSDKIISGTNVLSVVAQLVAGRWLRILVVVDGIAVMAGGILAGIFTLCGLVDRLTRFLCFHSFPPQN
jgi:hypothetical protein